MFIGHVSLVPFNLSFCLLTDISEEPRTCFFNRSIYFYVFIYGCIGSLVLRVGFLYLWRAGATLRASHCVDFPCCRAQALGRGLQQLWHAGSVGAQDILQTVPSLDLPDAPSMIRLRFCIFGRHVREGMLCSSQCILSGGTGWLFVSFLVILTLITW